jgi:hypothetical protein
MTRIVLTTFISIPILALGRISIGEAFGFDSKVEITDRFREQDTLAVTKMFIWVRKACLRALLCPGGHAISESSCSLLRGQGHSPLTKKTVLTGCNCADLWTAAIRAHRHSCCLLFLPLRGIGECWFGLLIGIPLRGLIGSDISRPLFDHFAGLIADSAHMMVVV